MPEIPMKNIRRLFFLLLFAFMTAFAHETWAETAFYVSLAGNDSWSGKLREANRRKTDGPFASLEKAREAIRALKRNGGSLKGGITVYIREGVFPRNETFRLTVEDSGTGASPIVWRTYPPEKVQLVGGREVAGFGPVTDPEVLKRIDPAFRGNIVQADLRAQGITNYGTITNRGGPGLELFFRDRRMTLARWPNEGWVRIIDVPQTGELVFKGQSPHMRNGIPTGRHYGRFTYEGDRPSRWTHVDEIILHGYWCWDWYDEFLKVKSIDAKIREIFIREPHSGYGYCKGQRYYAFNILEELDTPGEWYLDREKGILYFWPPAPRSEGRAFVSLLETPLIALENTSYVTIRGLNLEFSRGSGISVNGGSRNLVAGCTLRNLGATAALIEGGARNGITGCDVSDVASGGIVLSGGDRKTLAPGENFASNNHIHDYSAWIRTYQSAITISGVANRVEHNLIHDAPHSGIMLSGNDHLIQFNELHTLAQQTGDVGAFYMGRDWTQRGNIIRYNYFHDLLGPGLEGVMAVYLDDWSSGTTIFGNVFYKAGRSAFIGGGRDNTVENNIFVECAPSVHVDARGLGWAKYYFDGTTNTLFERMDAMNYKQPPYNARYPELLKIYNDEPAVPKYNKIVRNVSYGGRWMDLYDGMDFSIVTVKDNLIADPEVCTWVRKEKGTVTYKAGDREIMSEMKGNRFMDGDPGFEDVKKGDFRLKKNSPAWKLGFQPIPFEKIGLALDDYRKKKE